VPSGPNWISPPHYSSLIFLAVNILIADDLKRWIAGHNPGREMEVFPFVAVSCGIAHHHVAKEFCLFFLTWPTLLLSQRSQGSNLAEGPRKS
jgi:hypothetical protein